MSGPEVAPEPDAAKEPEPSLGARLRSLREARGMSASALARVLGISASAMSQIERDVMQPSVSRLIAITDALGVPLAEVFGDATGAGVGGNTVAALPTDGFALTRQGQAGARELVGGVLYRRLSPLPTPGVDFFESTYPPGASAHAEPELFRHEGHEVGNVHSGFLTIDFDDERVVLGPGDAISYPCSRPHRIHNAGTEPAVATWLIVHP